MSANFAKVTRMFHAMYVKRLSNIYGKTSKNNKFHKILHLEREKVKNGFEMSANAAKIAKVTRKIFVIFAIFAIFADILRFFLASFLSKSGILLHLFFFCNNCDICHGCFQLA